MTLIGQRSLSHGAKDILVPQIDYFFQYGQMGSDQGFESPELFQCRRIVSQGPLKFIELRPDHLCSAIILIEMQLLARNGKSTCAAFRLVQATRQRLQRNEYLLGSTGRSMGFLFVNEIVECTAA